MGLTPGPTSAKSPLQSRHLLSTAILNQIVEQIPIWEPIKGKAYVWDLEYWVCALHSPYCDLAAAAAAKSLQSCPTLWPHRWQPTTLRRPWDSPGKNTGVGCHFLLQCMKVKSESEVAHSCLTLCNPMDCSLPGSSIHGIFQARDHDLATLQQRSREGGWGRES